MFNLRSKIRTIIKEEYSNLPTGYSEEEKINIEYNGYDIDGDEISIYTTNFNPLNITTDDLIEYLMQNNQLENILKKYLLNNSGDLVEKTEENDIDPFDNQDR